MFQVGEAGESNVFMSELEMNLPNLQTLESPSKVLSQWHQQLQNGLFQIVSSSRVVWHIAIQNGRVHYATHSLQTPKTLEFYLKTLGYGKVIVAGEHILNHHHQALTQNATSSNSSYTWGAICIQELESQGILSPYLANHLIDALSKESIETALWETTGTIQRITHTIAPESPLLSWNGVHFDSLIRALQKRQQTWLSISDAIQSPYQRPYCTNVARIHEAGSGGALPATTLKLLVKLMTGRSIRQIAQILKQDELKFAQLLYPYVKYGIVSIHPPAAHFNQLPLASSTVESNRLEQPPFAPAKRSSPSSPLPRQAAPQQTTVPRQAVVPPSPRPTINSSLNLNQTPVIHHSSHVNQTTAPVSQVPGGSDPPQKRYKIVCIDDNASMLEILEQYLEADCFEVTTVANPMQSISALFAAHPDLVLMDVSMPGINGHRLCQILKRSSAFKTTPIIMVSGNTGALDKATAKSMGATDYLEKPFSQKALLQIINEHLRGTYPDPNNRQSSFIESQTPFHQ